MMITLISIMMLLALYVFIMKIPDWVDNIKNGPKYNDFGGTEDFSSRNEYDEKDPWSMFRETK